MRGWQGAAAALMIATAGCSMHRPDVAGDAARLTGVSGAIVFRGGLAAAVPAVGDTLTMEQAVRLCLEQDPRIQGALARVRIAEADAGQARLLPNPILSVDMRFPTEAGTGQTVEATLAADVLSLLQKPGQIAAADKRLRGAASDALTVVLDVMQEVEGSFAAARALEVELAAAKDRTALTQRMADIGDKRRELGDASRLDTLLLRAQVAVALSDERDLGVQRHAERLHLGRLIGSARGPVEWKLEGAATVDETVAPEEEWVAAALRNRPELQSKTWEMAALGDDLTAATFSPLVGGDLGAHAEHDPTWRAGPTVSVPLPVFDWGQGSRAKIKAQRMAARADLEETAAEIIQNVRTAYAAYIAAGAALREVSERVLPAQREVMAEAQRSYDAGDAELVFLLQAQADFRTVAVKEIDLREKLIVARGQLMRAAGGAGVGAALLQATTQPSTAPQPAGAMQPASDRGPATQKNEGG